MTSVLKKQAHTCSALILKHLFADYFIINLQAWEELV